MEPLDAKSSRACTIRTHGVAMPRTSHWRAAYPCIHALPFFFGPSSAARSGRAIPLVGEDVVVVRWVVSTLKTCSSDGGVAVSVLVSVAVPVCQCVDLLAFTSWSREVGNKL